MQSSAASHPVRGVGKNRAVLCVLLLLLAGSEFVMRGPVRAIRTATQFNDFLSPYIQANALLKGLDPYSPQVLLQLWPAQAPHFEFLPREVANGRLVANRGIPTAYPITALLLIAPFSLLPWNLAYAVWLALNLFLFGIMLRALVALAGFSYSEPRTLLLLAAILALAPIHTGIVTGNVTLAAVELGVIAIWAARRGRDMAAGFLLAAATGLKPQIGLCFLLYYLLRRRWRVGGIALALLGMLEVLGLARLEVGHTPWLSNYLSDNRILLETGVLGNFTTINPTRFGLINLQVALYPVLGSVRWANVTAAAIGGALLVAWLKFVRTREPDNAREIIDLSALAVISLLPVYHRFYDATLLVLPVCWVLISFFRARRFAVIAALLMLPFLIPGGTLLETMQAEGRIPGSLSNLWWWQAVAMAHQVWMLLCLGVLLLWEMLDRERVYRNRGLTAAAGGNS